MALALTGCVDRADWEAAQPWIGGRAIAPAGDLHGSHTLGQSFVSHRAGLDAIEVMLVEYEQSDRPDVPLELRLCRDVRCREEIARTTVPVEAIVHNATYRLSCPPQPDSAGRTYFLLAAAPEASSPARVTLWASAGDQYPDGTLLEDGQPRASDLVFWTYYDTDGWGLLAGLSRQLAEGLPDLGSLLLLLLAPGYLLARLLPRAAEEDALALLGMTLGLSVAVAPVLLLLLSLAGPVLTPPAVIGGGLFLGLLALGLLIWDVRRGRWCGAWRGAAAPGLALAGVLGAALLQRAVQAADLPGPLWVDAVHHTLLARLIVERAAIPGDYLPYIQVSPATYHFGFQSLMAVLHHLSGRPLPGTLLLLGQSLSGLSGLPLYALGRRWGGNRWAGLAAALVPSAIALMPAYYISWSRYTELTGLFILPVAALLWERWLSLRRWHGGLGVLAAVALAGQLVTHLRVAAFLGVLVLPLLLQVTFRRRYRPWAMVLPWARALLATAAAAALIWPWLGPSIQHLWLPAAQAWPAGGDTLALFYAFHGPTGQVAWLFVAGAVLALLGRRRRALLLFLWVGLLLLLANPRLVGLQPGGPLERLWPGLHVGEAVDNTSVSIALYVPLGLAAALAVGEGGRLAGWVWRRWTSWQGLRARPTARRPGAGHPGPAASLLAWVGAGLLVGLGGWGVFQLREVVNPRTALLAAGDLPAMAWIEENTAPDSLFLINSSEWMSFVYAGTDGGYWITPLTGRRTWPPPALYGLGSAEYIATINRVAGQAMAASSGEELYRLLMAHSFTHVYLGRYGGEWTAEELLACPHFRPVYREHGVWIFRLEP